MPHGELVEPSRRSEAQQLVLSAVEGLTSCHNSTRLKKVFNLFNCLPKRTRIPFFDFFHNGWIEDYSISIRQMPPIESILSLNVERALWHLYCSSTSTLLPNIHKSTQKEFS